MKIKIIYNEADTINKSVVVEGRTPLEAVTVFQVENPNADIVGVEQVDD